MSKLNALNVNSEKEYKMLIYSRKQVYLKSERRGVGDRGLIYLIVLTNSL
jgi:hypothetical protein